MGKKVPRKFKSGGLHERHVVTKMHTYNKILNYDRIAPICYGASAPFSGSFHIAFAEVTKY